MTRAELLARVSSRELTEWQAYATVEPFGEERADYRAALVAMTMANLWKGKKQKPFKITDFLLKFEGPQEPPSVEQMMAAFGLITGSKR